MNNTQYSPSTVEELKVLRESEAGVFLDGGTGNTCDDILLHKNQQTAPVAVGDTVKVFLYLDPSRKLTASMRVPKMRVGQIARLQVINVSKDGVFLDVGAERGIFMPYAGMRGRPGVGEIVWAKLYTDKSGRLAMTMEVEDELRRSSLPAKNVKRGDRLHGSVYNITEAGVFVFTDQRYFALIPHKEIENRPRVGEEIDFRVTYVREDGRLNGSLRLVKRKAIPVDAEKILLMLQQRGGKMPYSDDTPPEVIKEVFKISKGAFKRALGHLLKEDLIEQRSGSTYLKQ